jgi:hypothetical protein
MPERIINAGAKNAQQSVKAPPVKTGGKDKKGNLFGVKGAQAMDDQVQSHIKGTLDGSIKRFDDKTISMMKQGLFETTRGQAKQSKRNLRAELARSGTLRSGALARGTVDIDNAANASFTQGVRDIMLEKAKAEFDDKNVAIQQAQGWLKSKQDYDLGIKQMQTTLKAASIQAGATVAAAKLGADATKRAAASGAGAARYAADQQFQLGMANLQLKADSIALQGAAMGLR